MLYSYCDYQGLGAGVQCFDKGSQILSGALMVRVWVLVPRVSPRDLLCGSDHQGLGAGDRDDSQALGAAGAKSFAKGDSVGRRLPGTGCWLVPTA